MKKIRVLNLNQGAKRLWTLNTEREFWYCDTIPEITMMLFLAKIEFPSSQEGCWIWKGCVNPSGYGMFNMIDRPALAHRVGYHMMKGPIEPRLHLHHTCQNKLCVNPNHLQPVAPELHAAVGDHRRPVGRYYPRKVEVTKCIRGHSLIDPDNVRITSQGKRLCLACAKMRQQTRQERVIAARGPKPEKTECPNGHPWVPENIYTYKNSSYCRLCHNINSLAYVKRRNEDLLKIEKKLNVDRYSPYNAERCSRGHLFTPENTAYGRTNSRGKKHQICIACRRIKMMIAYYKKTGDVDRLAEWEAKLPPIQPGLIRGRK